MLFLGEFLQYLFKYVILLSVAVIGAICGAKYKKRKLSGGTEEKKVS